MSRLWIAGPAFLDRVVGRFATPKIVYPIGRLDSFAGVVEPPILSIDEKVAEFTPGGRLPGRSLKVSCELISQKIGFLTAQVPAVVLKGAKVEVIEPDAAFFPKEGELQLTRTV